jgi:hypothetical protein
MAKIISGKELSAKLKLEMADEVKKWKRAKSPSWLAWACPTPTPEGGPTMTDRVILRAASAALALANFLFAVWLLGPGTCQKMEGHVTGLMYCTLPSGEEVTS